jgi:hypothetical protein
MKKNEISLSETRKNKKLLIVNENQFRFLFESDGQKDEILKLQTMLKASDESNIELAFTWAEALGISEGDLLEPFRGLFEFIKKCKQINSKKLNKETFIKIKSLHGFSLARQPITELPELFRILTNLKSLNLAGANFSQLPEWFGNLTNLSWLYLAGVPLSNLPISFGNLENLENLYLQETLVSNLPKYFGDFRKLKFLDLSGTLISQQERYRVQQMLPSCDIKF